MTKRIRDLVETYLIKTGRDGKAQLVAAIGKSERTLDRWLEDGIPTAHDAFTLAKAVGVNEDEALALAKEECSSEAARETA